MPPFTTNIPGRMSIVKNRRLYVESSLSRLHETPKTHENTNYPSSKPKDNIMGISKFSLSSVYPGNSFKLTLRVLQPSHLSGM